MTESEEMYLVSVLRIKETGEEGPVPLTRLAAEMEIAPVSVNQMVRKLEDAGWLHYVPYKGVELTETGHVLGRRVLRHRRLWEVFLVEKLKIGTREAEELACKLEHYVPDDVVERLADFLSHPLRNPRGLSIPPADAAAQTPETTALIHLAINERGIIVNLETDNATLSFLYAQNLLPGSLVLVIGLGSDGSILLQTQAGNTIHLASTIAQTVFVLKTS